MVYNLNLLLSKCLNNLWYVILSVILTSKCEKKKKKNENYSMMAATNFAWHFNPCRAEYIQMSCPFLIFSQSDYMIQVDRNSHT